MNQPEPIQPPNKQYLHDFTPGATLPLAQSVLTAIIIGVAVYVVAAVGFDALDPIRPALVIGTLSLAGMWILSMRRWWDLTALERALHLDLNGDGHIGEPEPTPEPPTIRVHISKDDHGHYESNTYDVPASAEQLEALAAGLLNGQPFTEREWAGKDKPFSSQEFRALRSDMLRRGLIELVNDKDPRQGYRLTEEGRAVMQEAMPEAEVVA